MTYNRTAPRDIFNEANYMKCVGRISLLLHDRPIRGLKLNTDGWECNGTIFDQDDSDGSLFDSGFLLELNGCNYVIRRPLNSREDYPVYILNEDCEEVQVLDDYGNFTPELLALIKR